MCPRYKAIYSQQSFNFSRTDVSVLKKCTTVGYVFVCVHSTSKFGCQSIIMLVTPYIHTYIHLGCVFILLTTPGSPKIQLFHRFYLHEHGWPMKFSDAATENLDTLGVEYSTELINGELNFTKCFRDGFQKPHQRFLLDFMTHTKVERYPPEISQLCVEFLASAAVGKPEQYIIPFSVAFIVCKSNSHF